MGMVMDPRCGRKTKHNHAEILICLVAGFLAGRNSIRRCLKWCENHKDFLKQNMKLENGIASPATVSRILGNIDEEMFGLVLIEWMTSILSTKGINISIDGKALRGSMKKIKNKKTPYILNVIDTATALVIAQLPIEEKENEITAIPRLLELLNIKGSLVTIDAIGTAQPIMDAIQKKKQKEIKTVGWLEQVRIPMEKDKEGNDITPGYEEFLKNGTVRKPKITVGDDLTDEIHRVCIISSRMLSAQEALQIKRSHWKIENSLHYVLDDLSREDRSSAAKSKNNLAVIRKIVYNLLRIAICRENKESGPTEMRDQFSDDLTLIEKYVFRGISHL